MASQGKSPYLSQPITQKGYYGGVNRAELLDTSLYMPHWNDIDTRAGNGKGNLSDVKYGMSSMQGWRITMEDAHTHVLPLKENPDLSFFGVFDGHGGNVAANFVGKHLLTYIRNSKSYAALGGEINGNGLRTAMIEGFKACDKELKRFPIVKSGEDHSGSTAVTCFVTPDDIIVANAGDSRLVLSRDGKEAFVTVDHKPSNEAEEARIVAAGGIVNNNRINGDLAAARAFGDFRYKEDRGLEAHQQMVSVIPDVTVLERTKSDDFLILACDGVWDVMTNQEAISFVLAAMRLGASLSSSCALLLDECLRKSSQDNISAIIVGLDNLPKETGRLKSMQNPPTIEKVRSAMANKVL